ncbi:MAG: hypothetical protein DHS20C15_24970 [Planctomycetota bacterium]|nr:MAG: hypothetical protein DHS20C15_24970 [Planctomycetota bacterium]
MSSSALSATRLFTLLALIVAQLLPPSAAAAQTEPPVAGAPLSADDASAGQDPGEVYAVLNLSDVTWTDELAPLRSLPTLLAPASQIAAVLLPAHADAFVCGLRAPISQRSFFTTTVVPNAGTAPRLAVRVPRAETLRGELVLEASTWSEPESVRKRYRFEIPASAFSAEQRDAWLEAQANHDALLVSEGVAGAAYFRHRHAQIRKQLELDSDPLDGPERVAAQRDSVADTFELFSGARAISENLALDRRLPASAFAAESVPLSSIPGVEVRPYDWEPLLEGLTPEVDPLASLIPADQYALLFPDFASLMRVLDHVQDFGAPVVELLEPRAVDVRSLERLEAQLGLPRSLLARTVGPQVIRSVAITGAGYELRTGTDIAMIFEAVNADVLHGLITARVRAEAAKVNGATVVPGTIRQVEYELLTTPDRRLCSYVAKVGTAVVVSNSLPQLRRVIATHEGRKENLASLPEYVFFRDRYPRGDADESAFALLSDATIRRWCGPRWRIGASRVARARAGLLEVQARRLDELAANQLIGSVRTPDDLADLGRLQADAGQINSTTWGSRDFSTPVLELQIDGATEDEAALYERWRSDYERNWSEAFDPIAARITLSADRLDFDMSVRPLIANSDYARMISPVRGGALQTGAADPHDDALLHWAMAVDPDDPPLRSLTPFAMSRSLGPSLDPLQWLGGAVAFWLDEDPYWTELAAAEDPEEFALDELYRLPVALHADVRNGFLLAGFLAAGRAMIEGSAPGMLLWETREHEGLPYVRISPTELAWSEFGVNAQADDSFSRLALYYVASGEGITLSLSEPVVQRALLRQKARRASASGNDEPSTDTDVTAPSSSAPHEWLGEHLGLRMDVPSLLDLLDHTMPRGLEASSPRALSWSNLPILNEWHQRFPGEDPVSLHQRLWGERLVCPGGGEYRWNAQDNVMESSVYGHPGRPLDGPKFPRVLDTLGHAEFGLEFEDDGLRARATLELRAAQTDER